MATGFAVLTALLGGLLALGFAGRLALSLAALTDVHASWGVLGRVVVLLASVARVVLAARREQQVRARTQALAQRLALPAAGHGG